MAPSLREKNILRSLAARFREHAEEPAMDELRHEWKRHNALMPGRPMILCEPEGSWRELLPDSALACEDGLLREWERGLRRGLYLREVIKDDHPLEPFIDVHRKINVSDYGVRVNYTRTDGLGSYVWDPPIKDLDKDIDKLRFREMTIDREASALAMELAQSIFGDILQPRFRGDYWWTMGLTQEAIKLVGLEELMTLPYMNPDGLHRLMRWLSDEHMHHINWFEEQGVLSLNNGCDGVGSGGIGYTDRLPQPDWRPGMRVWLKDMWGFAESQETVGVSPDIFAEFVLPYQLPLLDRFGLNCYGCCEPVHNRWQHVTTIPRLRRISVSPWCDQEFMARELDNNYIFSRKPNPTMVCVGFDEAEIRGDIRATLAVASECVLEVIMKDVHTVQNDTARLPRWVEIAREESAAETLLHVKRP